MVASLQKCFKADRFKFAGSASTCPKSGKIVPVKVKFEPTPILKDLSQITRKIIFFPEWITI